MSLLRSTIIILVSLLIFSSCKKDEPEEKGTYSSGVFVINEGAFQTGTGTITFFEPQSRVSTPEIFQKENGFNVLGNIAQSMTLVDDKGYILINNASKIEVVTADDFKSLTTINGIDQPRSMLAINNSKAYVSAWGADGTSGKIHVLDLSTNTIEKSIETGGGPEKMIQDGNDIYITKSGGFGRDSRVLVLNVLNDEITDTINVGDNPIGIVKGLGNEIWVLCRGHNDFSDPLNNTNGVLILIRNKTIADQFTLSNGANELVINRARTTLYFTMDGKIMKHDFDDLVFENEVFVNQGFYALAVDPSSDNLYCADAKDFASNGEVIIYGSDGIQIEMFEAGIVPSDFAFNN
jgi:hypothetical protein